MSDDIARIAERLRGTGAGRACLRMTTEWQFAGQDTFTAGGAWSLHHYERRAPLAEYEVRGKLRSRRAYRLTPIGEQVRAYLERQP